MDYQKIFNHFSGILNDLIDSSAFYKIYFQSPYTTEDDIEINSNISLHTGIARACLVDKSYDYVVKLNFDGIYDCQRECEIYEEYYGVEEVFARPVFLGTYTKNIYFYTAKDVEDTIDTWNDKEEFDIKFPTVVNKCRMRPITISFKLFTYPRATKYIFNTYTEEDEEYASNSDSPLREFNLAIAASFVGDFGTERYNELTDFLNEWGIGDIHFGNVGKINNHIAILDYAGLGE